jgi:hypothetical protein
MGSNPVRIEPEKSVLQQAEELINGQRAEDYGSAAVNFTQIAAFWNATLGLKLREKVTAQDVALCMMGVKMARLAKTPYHEDSIVDVAGYAGCLAKVNAGLAKTAQEALAVAFPVMFNRPE